MYNISKYGWQNIKYLEGTRTNHTKEIIYDKNIEYVGLNPLTIITYNHTTSSKIKLCMVSHRPWFVCFQSHHSS